MPYVTVSTSDELGIRTATAVRVVDEYDANSYVFDALSAVSEGHSGTLLDLYGSWLDVMNHPCICENDCPRSMAFILPDGEALFSYYETSPFIF